ncbi:helix-turn-helix domain-containing protein [Bradyrhizobium sp. HKCCYLS2038]|uniref:helix-turn-helix domain-containing protein n=1 Tax=Bradyrhizobium sp. HKCCYLS2038 TaxID=3420764 RepID=UPI003EBB45FA
MSDQEIDGAWFTKRLEEKQLSMRGLARHLELDVSAVSRMFSGSRKMKMNEASAIAHFLGAPVSEVLKHAGVSVDIDGQPTRIMLAAAINEKGQIERLKDPRPLPQQIIDRANAAISMRETGNSRILAAQIRATQGPLTFLDDAVVLFGHTEGVERAAIGVLAICRSNQGEQILAKIERARKTGEARVVCVDGKVKEFALDTATPVIAIIP